MASKSCFIFPVQVYNLFTLLTCIRLDSHDAFLLVEALQFSGNSQFFVFGFLYIYIYTHTHLNGHFPALSACILYICLKIFSFSPCKFHFLKDMHLYFVL